MYNECIEYYKELAKSFDNLKITECGETDSGKPLHFVIVSKDKLFEPEAIRNSGKIVLLVNNGIHPGEPDGIDACMMLLRDLALNKIPARTGGPDLLEHVVVIAIPIYNIDGVLNRNNYSRVNQVGPKEYGFRGNAENRDLNRDFIKCDTRNARSFVQIFQQWKPELFVDTHVSDGADYTYTMTLISTMQNKLDPGISSYMTKELIPYLEKDMKAKNMEMCPYVDTYGSTPDSGLVALYDSPRYSTGYVSLFNTIGFMSETHMLKTHAERVRATYQFLVSLLNAANKDYEEIRTNKTTADNNTINKQDYVIQWQLDTNNYSKILFKGYEAKYKKSDVTGFERLYYDRSAPYSKEINFYDKYILVVTVRKPIAYIIPQGWRQVIDLLKLNGVKMKRFTEDQPVKVESYYIDSFSTRIPPFEGHYLHSNTKVKTITQTRKFFDGDYVVYTNQVNNNFIMNVLEPQATDSYFNWNFFDAILQQKEYYEPYLFEDIAESVLKSDPELRTQFEEKKKNDTNFKNDPNAQLDFIYNNSRYHEPEYMRYPVSRLITNQELRIGNE
jgi:hypothetical protein